MSSVDDVRLGVRLMGTMKKEFGFYPEPLRLDAGSVKVRTLPNFRSIVDSVGEYGEVEDGWIYAPPSRVRGLASGEVRTRSYSRRGVWDG